MSAAAYPTSWSPRAKKLLTLTSSKTIYLSQTLDRVLVADGKNQANEIGEYKALDKAMILI